MQKAQEEPKTDSLAEELDFTRPDYVFIPKGTHVYKQQGYYLICQSCELKHAVYIGKDKILVGMEDDKPILKTRKELEGLKVKTE